MIHSYYNNSILESILVNVIDSPASNVAQRWESIHLYTTEGAQGLRVLCSCTFYNNQESTAVDVKAKTRQPL